MILVLLGSQKFNFNRLLKEIDHLIDDNMIEDEVFAQIGFSDYKPRNYKYKRFIEKELFISYIKMADIIITHAGTATIISALKAKKKVIAVARLKKFNEHVSNHQLDIIRQFNDMKLIVGLEDVADLGRAITDINTYELKPYISNTNRIIELIEKFVDSNCNM